MKILLTGASGLVGSRFLELSKFKEDLLTPSASQLDITNSSSVKNYLSKEKPEVIFHLAAFTDVAAGESQRGDHGGACWNLNVIGVENIVKSITPGTHLIYISTDMVFSGSGQDPGPYEEGHRVEANSDLVTWYGYSKGQGEKLVRETIGEMSTIVRIICPVRSKFKDKLDFLRKPLKLFDEGKLYPMFTDQQVSITFVDELCHVLDEVILGKKFGIFHVSSDVSSPYEMVSYLLNKTRGEKAVVQKSLILEFLEKAESPVRYPQFGGLTSVETQNKLGIKFLPWQNIIDTLVEQGISY